MAAIWRVLPNRVNWWVLGWGHARFMVSVVGVITDDAGRVLLLRHRFWNGRAWGLPSGYARRAETLEAALAREIREESGLTIASPHLVTARRATPAAMEVVFRATVASGTSLPHAPEILAARFVAIADLGELVPSHIVRLIQRALERPPQG
jgi:8-oxo-dGTP diphosphatase